MQRDQEQWHKITQETTWSMTHFKIYCTMMKKPCKLLLFISFLHFQFVCYFHEHIFWRLVIILHSLTNWVQSNRVYSNTSCSENYINFLCNKYYEFPNNSAEQVKHSMKHLISLGCKIFLTPQKRILSHSELIPLNYYSSLA